MLRFRSVLALLPCLVLCCAAGSAQTGPFTTHTYAAGTVPRDLYAIDVNNDGVPDIVENTGRSLVVMIANGSGGFGAPTTIYTFPTTYQGTTPLAYGDFNGDGKVDLVCAMAGTNQLAVFLGNGNGTFQAPRYETITMPQFSGGVWFGGGAIVAADFNRDGKLDLLAEANNNTTDFLFIMSGDGAGNFGAALTVNSFLPGSGVGSLSVGDFDGDGNVDYAVGVNSNCTNGGCSQGEVDVLYGDGKLDFDGSVVYRGTPFAFSAGDVNSDGRTDLFGYAGADSNQLVVLTSQPDRQFTTFTMPTNYTMQDAGFGTAPTMVLANFDGDSKYTMDIAGLGYNSSGQEAFIVFAANGSGGYQETTTDLPATQSITNLVVGDFNRDLEPDVATILSNGSTTAPTLEVGLNNSNEPPQNWGGCAYPTTGQGVAICEPEQNMQTSVWFDAAANSFGMLRKIEVWVDGKKIGEQYHVWENRGWIDLTAKLATGSHKATFFATDVDGRQQKAVVTFQANDGCLAPASPGVNLCQPSGSIVTSNVQVVATGKVTGTLASMQLWVDGVKKFSESSSATLQTTVTVGTGTHRFAVLAVNTAGQKWEQAVNATVQ